jgi:hypothetical protein
MPFRWGPSWAGAAARARAAPPCHGPR